MAEKEERIRVLIAKNPCEECSVKKCTRKCMFGLLFEKAPGITRAEAIERIAKALIRADYPNAQESIWAMRWKNHASKDYYLIMANAALNALLEAK